jgi:hypothetical protein
VLSRAAASRGYLWIVLAGVCVTGGVLMLFSGVARAGITHPYTGVSFGPGGVGAGSFSQVAGVAVAQANGDVFVLDTGEGGRVYKFDAAGKPVDFSSSATNAIDGVGSASGSEEEIAVDNSTGPDVGDIYVANNNVVRIYAASGAPLEELSGGEMCGVAIGATGEVYVGIYPGTVRRYKPVTNPVTDADESASMEGLPGICNVAVDKAGDVYAAKYNGEVSKYEALQFGSLSASGMLVDPRGRTLAVDPTSGTAFIDDENEVNQYDGETEPPTHEGAFGASGEGALGYSFGIAVAHSSGELYVANSGNVEIFGPGVVTADASAEAATGVSASSATLRATVDPNGDEVTGCVFEYGSEGVSSYTAACTPTPPYTGSSPVAVTTQAASLSPGTTYHYRLALTEANGEVHSEVKTFTTLGPSVSSAYAEAEPTSAMVRAEVDPGSEATTYYVEYGTTTAYGSRTIPVELQAGEVSVAVSLKIPGLRPNTKYHLRFIAETATATAVSNDIAFVTLPILEGESFSAVGTNRAAVAADIDPGGATTTYRIEYGTTTAYGSSTTPVSVGSGNASMPVIAYIEELRPGTFYHFRFVAENAIAAESGSDLTFTTRPVGSSGLPDDRGYEMVTPAENQGAEVYAPVNAGYTTLDAVWTLHPFQASADGSAVTYAGSPTSDGDGSEGVGVGNQFLARRAPGSGWSQTNIQPSGYGNVDGTPDYWGFSSDLERGVALSNEPLAAGAPARGYHDLYVRDLASGVSQPLFTGTPPNREPSEFGAFSSRLSIPDAMGKHYAGASANFSHVLFAANDALTSGAAGGPGEFAEENNLYDAVDGRLLLVNVLPDGAPAPNASFGAEANGGLTLNFSHVISASGARIFWTDLKTGALYVRENGDETKLIADAATYLTASTDGTKVLYLKSGDMYEDQLETGITRDLTAGGEMIGILGASEDLDYIYFVAESALAAGSSQGGLNLYLYHEGQTRFIANPGGESAEIYQEGEAVPWQSDLGRRTAEVTPSGHDLVFMSAAKLTGYNNFNAAESTVEHEVYLYDAESRALTCVSCDPTGEPPNVSDLLERVGGGGFFPISGYPTFQPRVVSEDGSRVFFESVEPILPQARNNELNVYEWERDGAGSCQFANGCIYLLSTGSSPTPSYFIDASASGNDVFFMTRSQLVPADENEYLDVYDAHVGAVQAPAVPQCTGTGCQGVQATPPVFATPASVTYAGVGNFEQVSTPAVKSPAKPKKKQSCVAKTKKKRNGRKPAKAKLAACNVKRAAQRARHSKNGRGGR